MASKISINLDIRKDFNTVIKCKQNDDLPLEVNLFANGEPVDLTNKEIIINGTKDDNTYVKQNTGITKKNNIFNVDYLDRDFTRVPGTTKTEVVLLENGKQDTTFTFYLAIQPSVLKGAVESSNTITILEALDNKILEAGQVKEETEQLIESGNAATKGEVKELNASLEQKVNNNMVKSTVAPSIKSKKAIITFIDDDGGIGVYSKLAPLFINRNIPCCVAIITDRFQDSRYLSVAQAKKLQDTYGWEICSHTQSHKAINDDLTDEQLEYELRGSLDKLNSLGLRCENMIYPFGSPSQKGRAYTRKFYNCGANAETGKINYSPVKTFNLDRVALGSYTYSGKDTLDYYKSKVDECKNNGGWLIFMTHIDNTDATQFEYLKQTLDYVLTSGVDVVTLKDGLSIYGNNVEIGEFTDKTQSKFSVFDNENNFYADNLRHYFKEPTGITSSTPITSYEIGVTVTAFNASNTGNGFPGTMGTLLTYRPHKTTNELGFQMWYRLDTNDAQMRKWTGSSWGGFVNINNSKNIVLGNNGLNLSDIETVRVGYITTTYITDAYALANGFPNNIGGELKIVKLNGEYNFWYSEYRPRNSEKVYMRFAISNTQWGEFNLISMKLLKANASNLVGSLSTGVSKDVNFALTGLRLGDCVVAYPNAVLPTGVMFNVYYKQDDVATLRIMNLSGTTLDLGTVDWKLFVIKC